MEQRLSQGAIMRTELNFFMYFCIKKYIGTQGEVCRQLKIFLNPPVVYATDRSKAVAPVFLAHLSRRLTRWAYSIPIVRRPSVIIRRPSSSTLSNLNITEASGPILTKFYV